MHKCRILLALLLSVFLLAPAGAQQFRQPPPYRILVTNDDGVRAPGLVAVAQILQLIGTPIIVAPSENQSGERACDHHDRACISRGFDAA